MNNHRTRVRCYTAAVTIALLLCAACAGKPPQQTQLMAEMGTMDASTAELRIRVYDYTVRFCDTVDAAAEEIIVSSTDPEIRHRALLWRAYAIATAQKAAFKRDPIAGLIDIWTFASQMTLYFDRGPGLEAFGDWQSLAIETCRDLEEQAAEVARLSITNQDITKAREFVASWAQENPLHSMQFQRRSPLMQWLALAPKDQGGLSAVASMEASMNDLSNRLTLYADVLPKQARWQSQLLLEDYFGPSRPDRFFADVTSIEESALRIATVIDSLGIFLQRLQSEEVRLDRRVEGVFSEVDRQRLATLQELERTRESVMTDLRGEKEAALHDLDAFSLRTMKEASARVDAAIDRLFLRLTQLLAALLGVILLVALIWRRIRARG